MTETSTEDGSSAVPLESLPNGSLSQEQLGVLEQAEVIEIAAPLVMERGSDRVTHLDLVIDDTHYYVGWNPDKEQWEQILVVTDEEESVVVEEAATVSTGEAGEAELGFDAESEPEIEDIVEFIWEYVGYTYSETDRLRNIIGQAAEELPDEE